MLFNIDGAVDAAKRASLDIVREKTISERTEQTLLEDRRADIQKLRIVSDRIQRFLTQPESTLDVVKKSLSEQKAILDDVSQIENVLLRFYLQQSRGKGSEWVTKRTKFEEHAVERRMALAALMQWNETSATQLSRPTLLKNEMPQSSLLLLENSDGVSSQVSFRHQRFSLQATYFQNEANAIAHEAQMLKPPSTPSVIVAFEPPPSALMQRLSLVLNGILKRFAEWQHAMDPQDKLRRRAEMRQWYDQLPTLLNGPETKQFLELQVPAPALASDDTLSNLPATDGLQIAALVDLLAQCETQYGQALNAFSHASHVVELGHWCDKLADMAQTLGFDPDTVHGCSLRFAEAVTLRDRAFDVAASWKKQRILLLQSLSQSATRFSDNIHATLSRGLQQTQEALTQAQQIWTSKSLQQDCNDATVIVTSVVRFWLAWCDFVLNVLRHIQRVAAFGLTHLTTTVKPLVSRLQALFVPLEPLNSQPNVCKNDIWQAALETCLNQIHSFQAQVPSQFETSTAMAYIAKLQAVIGAIKKDATEKRRKLEQRCQRVAFQSPDARMCEFLAKEMTRAEKEADFLLDNVPSWIQLVDFQERAALQPAATTFSQLSVIPSALQPAATFFQPSVIPTTLPSSGGPNNNATPGLLPGWNYGSSPNQTLPQGLGPSLMAIPQGFVTSNTGSVPASSPGIYVPATASLGSANAVYVPSNGTTNSGGVQGNYVPEGYVLAPPNTTIVPKGFVLSSSGQVVEGASGTYVPAGATFATRPGIYVAPEFAGPAPNGAPQGGVPPGFVLAPSDFQGQVVPKGFVLLRGEPGVGHTNGSFVPETSQQPSQPSTVEPPFAPEAPGEGPPEAPGGPPEAPGGPPEAPGEGPPEAPGEGPPEAPGGPPEAPGEGPPEAPGEGPPEAPGAPGEGPPEAPGAPGAPGEAPGEPPTLNTLKLPTLRKPKPREEKAEVKEEPKETFLESLANRGTKGKEVKTVTASIKIATVPLENKNELQCRVRPAPVKWENPDPEKPLAPADFNCEKVFTNVHDELLDECTLVQNRLRDLCTETKTATIIKGNREFDAKNVFSGGTPEDERKASMARSAARAKIAQDTDAEYNKCYAAVPFKMADAIVNFGLPERTEIKEWQKVMRTYLPKTSDPRKLALLQQGEKCNSAKVDPERVCAAANTQTTQCQAYTAASQQAESKKAFCAVGANRDVCDVRRGKEFCADAAKQQTACIDFAAAQADVQEFMAFCAKPETEAVCKLPKDSEALTNYCKDNTDLCAQLEALRAKFAKLDAFCAKPENASLCASYNSKRFCEVPENTAVCKGIEDLRHKANPALVDCESTCQRAQEIKWDKDAVCELEFGDKAQGFKAGDQRREVLLTACKKDCTVDAAACLGRLKAIGTRWCSTTAAPNTGDLTAAKAPCEDLECKSLWTCDVLFQLRQKQVDLRKATELRFKKEAALQATEETITNLNADIRKSDVNDTATRVKLDTDVEAAYKAKDGLVVDVSDAANNISKINDEILLLLQAIRTKVEETKTEITTLEEEKQKMELEGKTSEWENALRKLTEVRATIELLRQTPEKQDELQQAIVAETNLQTTANDSGATKWSDVLHRLEIAKENVPDLEQLRDSDKNRALFVTTLETQVAENTRDEEAVKATYLALDNDPKLEQWQTEIANLNTAKAKMAALKKENAPKLALETAENKIAELKQIADDSGASNWDLLTTKRPTQEARLAQRKANFADLSTYLGTFGPTITP